MGSILGYIYSLCLWLYRRCIINPSRRIRFPGVDECELQGTSIGPTVKRRALLVGISYANIESDLWPSLETPHQDVDLFWNLLVGK